MGKHVAWPKPKGHTSLDCLETERQRGSPACGSSCIQLSPLAWQIHLEKAPRVFNVVRHSKQDNIFTDAALRILVRS